MALILKPVAKITIIVKNNKAKILAERLSIFILLKYILLVKISFRSVFIVSQDFYLYNY